MKRPQANPSNSGTPHYQTFPTKPPPGRGRPPHTHESPSPRSTGSPVSGITRVSSGPFSFQSTDRIGVMNDDNKEDCSPSLYRQLACLAVISLAEQTALNSIAPYLPQMASSFPEVAREKVGFNVGLIASSFAAAQVLSNYFWGKLSDRIGRKPVIVLGTFLTANCFLAFGFCKRLWQAMVVQALMGAVNGNQVVVSTVLGEITNKSNRLEAFSWLPLVYGVGSIIGPVVGGLLAGVSESNRHPLFAKHPYLLPNLVAAGVLYLNSAIVMCFLEESLQQAQELSPLHQRFKSVFVRLWQFTIGFCREESEATEVHRYHSYETLCRPVSPESPEPLLPSDMKPLSYKSVLNTPVLLLLGSYFIFNFSNITFLSLYPIFVAESPPIGRGFRPKAIGLTIAIGGLAAILFQMLSFTKLQSKMGNKRCYAIGFLGMALAFFLMPMTSNPPQTNSTVISLKQLQKGAMVSVITQVSLVLLLRSVTSVMGLTCAMIMVTNCSPCKAVLGRINGLAQSLSAAGRAIGPFLSGALWSATLKLAAKRDIRKPEMLPWGVFGGLTSVGALLVLGINSGTIGGDSEVGSEAAKHRDEQDGVMVHEASNERYTEAETSRQSRDRGESTNTERTSLLP